MSVEEYYSFVLQNQDRNYNMLVCIAVIMAAMFLYRVFMDMNDRR
ncbi:MAG: hypothetical protein K0Q87_4940 [Neobacillus sp.]|nr:hypothetical protein [Neobacillus sp.]